MRTQEESLRGEELRSLNEKPANLEKQFGRVQEEMQTKIADNSSLRADLKNAQLELDNIKGSFGYKFMRFYASRIDRFLPDGTRRGDFKKIVEKNIRIASSQGIREWLRVRKITRLQPRSSSVTGSITEAMRKRRVILCCDTPKISSASPVKVSNSFFLSGWALADSPVKEVKIYLDDEFVGQAECGIVRGDVAEIYPDFPNAQRSGFGKFVHLDHSQNGTSRLSRLRVVAEFENIPPESTEGIIEISETSYFRPLPEIAKRKLLDARVTVAILTKSPPNDFELTLERLRNQGGVSNVEIIVINSGTTDLSHLEEKYKVIVCNILPNEFGHAVT